MPRRMNRRTQVTLRLPTDLYTPLATEAGRRRIPVNDYLRLCIERGHQADALDKQLTEIRYRLEEMGEEGGGDQGDGKGGKVPEDLRLIRTELSAIRKIMDTLVHSDGGGAPLSASAARELLRSAFVTEELFRESLAGRNPTAIRPAQERAEQRLGRVK